jgi:2-hydroxy-6-oxonona-2,4-dienedioate hydrolase
VNEQRYRNAEERLWATGGRRRSEHRVTLASTGTCVRVLEVGEGEPVLFVHGGPNAGSTWAPLVAHLEGLRCLLVDRPGTGLSEPFAITAANLPEVGSRFVGDVLAGLGIDRADVVASSFGGHLALRSAAAQPDRFRRMVQMAAPAAVPGQTFPAFMRSLRNPVVRWLMGALPPTRRIARKVMREIGHGASLDAGRIPEHFFDWYLALGRHTDTFRNDGRMIGTQILPNLDQVTLGAALLGSVRTPTLFLWGADDAFGDEANARMVTGMLPTATLEMLRGAGHLPWLDDPAGAARAVTAFLATRADALTSGPPVPA